MDTNINNESRQAPIYEENQLLNIFHSTIKEEPYEDEEYTRGVDSVDRLFNNNEVFIKNESIAVEEWHHIKEEFEEMCETSHSGGNVGENIENSLSGADDSTSLSSFDYSLMKKEVDIDLHEIKSEPDLSEDEADDIFSCSFCRFKTSSELSLRKHQLLHDPSKLLWHYCSKCSYRTKAIAHMKRHTATHLPSGECEFFICAICDSKFKQKCTLKRHLHYVHGDLFRKQKSQLDQNDQKFDCKECSYSTFKKGLFMAHLDKHKNTNDISGLYICDICSFTTKYRRNLRAHLETHKECTQLKVYKCSICKFQTRLGYCLKRHFLSKKHLLKVGQLDTYSPRSLKMKQEKNS
ncbi:hypothetical protein HUJ04_006589 [Dendroctonus ponderosae]|uniref:C2H2-type domain-containing protein n=1 Tax=Dendroctonus ponderosae TaxID=77166 RepID=A0AAR5Q4W2_DENPD|nr:hypothetical protein HUJ04_006589 [Dendroctonus ponderosae]KAH1005648.1 hypothetical protein HUJ04_006589 [Dendroctonus ponderosae]